MDHMKYIIVKGSFGLELPFIFDQSLSHIDVARNMVDPHRWAEDEKELKHTILSAGFVILTDEGLQCYGESHTLKMKSQEGDSRLLNCREESRWCQRSIF